MEQLKFNEELDFNEKTYQPDAWTYTDYLEVCDREHCAQSSNRWDKICARLERKPEYIDNEISEWVQSLDEDISYKDRLERGGAPEGEIPVVCRGDEPTGVLGLDFVYKDYKTSWYAFDVGGNLVTLGDFKTEEEAFTRANEIAIEYNEELHDIHKEYT